MPVAPFRVFGSTDSSNTLLRTTILLSDWLLVQSFRPAEVLPYWFGNPTMPLAVPSALWFSLSGRADHVQHNRPLLSSSLASV